MTVAEIVTLIVATGGALSSVIAAYRSGHAANTGDRNERSIHAVHEAVNGGLVARLAPIVKEATTTAITDTLFEREEQHREPPPP